MLPARAPRPTRQRRRSATNRPDIKKHILIYGTEETPLLVHDESLHRIEITHGCHKTVITLPRETTIRFVMNLTGNFRSPSEEFIRNENGRIVASYLPYCSTLVVRHQNKISFIQLPSGTPFQVGEEYCA